MADYSRRLPVYLLLDCSGSMMGEPIEAVRQGIKALLSELRGDPQALETAYLSVITFDSQKGDWRPLVFILTDGSPTDTAAFERAVQNIKSAKIANIVACAAGSNARTEHLKRITDNVLMMNTLSAGDMAQFFAWVSGSIKMSSKSLDAKPGMPLRLPPPPQGFVIVP